MRRATTFLLAGLAATSCLASAALPASQDKPPAPTAVAWQKDIEIEGPEAPLMTVGLHAVIVAGSDAGLSAYALADGRPLWRSPKTTAKSIAATGKLVAVVVSGAIEAFDQESGQPTWRAPLGEGPDPSLFATDELILVVRGAELRALRLDGAVAWQRTLPSPPATRVVAGSDALLIGLETPAVAALDKATGAVKWTAALPERPTGLTAVGDRLFVPGANGMLYAYRVERELKQMWKHRAVRAIGEPVVDERRVIYALTDNTLKAFDRNSGSQKWSSPLDARPASGPVLIGDTVVVPLGNGRIARVPSVTGTRPVGAPTADGAAKPDSPEKNDRLRTVATAAFQGTVYAIVAAQNETTTLIAWRAGG